MISTTAGFSSAATTSLPNAVTSMARVRVWLVASRIGPHLAKTFRGGFTVQAGSLFHHILDRVLENALARTRASATWRMKRSNRRSPFARAAST